MPEQPGEAHRDVDEMLACPDRELRWQGAGVTGAEETAGAVRRALHQGLDKLRATLRDRWYARNAARETVNVSYLSSPFFGFALRAARGLAGE